MRNALTSCRFGIVIYAISSVVSAADKDTTWQFGDPFYQERSAEYTLPEKKEISYSRDNTQCERRECSYEDGVLFLAYSKDNLGLVPAKTLYECCILCSFTERCSHFSFHDRICSLKASLAQWRSDTPYTSGIVSKGCACPNDGYCPLSPAACLDGEYLDLNECDCRPCKACEVGQFKKRECGLTYNAVCKKCKECAPGQIELSPCKEGADTVCHAMEFKENRSLYDVLGVPRDASQSEIRQKYKILTSKLHPDKNPDQRAAELFAEISAAYRILGDPDQRSTYDDFGDSNMEGFGSYWEYSRSQTRATKDFYTGEKLVTRLTDKNHANRLTHGVWFIKFYAPWCSHCISSSKMFKDMARELDGEIEFGAVNCVSEQGLQKEFRIQAFPSFFLVAPEYGFQLQYHWRGPEQFARDFPEWPRNLAREWKFLVDRSRIVKLNVEKFEEDVLPSSDVWIVMFIQGSNCVKCNEAQSNFFRFGSDVTGVARVGVADCADPELRLRVCHAHGVPDHNYPHFWIYRAGEDKEVGHELFEVDQVPAHLALPAIAKTLRAALTHYLVKEGEVLVAPEEDGEYEDNRKKEEENKPPPNPGYEQPPPRQQFQQLEGYGRPSHKALPQY